MTDIATFMAWKKYVVTGLFFIYFTILVPKDIVRYAEYYMVSSVTSGFHYVVK